VTENVSQGVRIAEALERSERRYRTVVDNIQEGVIVASRDEKLYYNGRMAEMLGFAPEEYAEVPFISLVHPEDTRAVVRRQADIFESGAPVSVFECRLLDKEGRIKWVRCKSSSIDWLGQEAAITFVEDVTAQVQAEAALRESVDIIDTMFRSVEDAFYLATTTDGRLIELNRGFEELFGYARDEAVGLTALELELWADPDDRARMLHELQSSGHVRNYEVVCKKKTGETFPCSISTTLCDIGGTRCTVGFIRDETERVSAEQALREKQEQLDRFFSLEVGLLCVTDLDGCFRLVSAGWVNTLGYTEEELMSRPFYEILHPEDLPATLAAADRLRAGEQIVDFVNRFRARDGNYRTIAWRSAPAGDLCYSAARDITELLAAEEQLRQSQKMEAIGQLAGGIAHDFNNLLTAILGYTDLVLASPEGHGEPLRLDLLEIKGAAKRAADLTQQILAFSRKQALRPEIICVNDVLRELTPLLDRLLGENIVLEVQTAEDLGQCEIDPGQFTQVLINLVVNARDAMPRGGFLILETVNAEVGKQDATLTIAGVDPGGYVVFKCSDTGSGMDASTSSRIFEPFFTTKRAGQGTGLGLSTVHGIVHQSGGIVLVESEMGKGTAFTIYLPRISGSVSGPGDGEKPFGARRGHGNIMVVEDEEAVGALARRVLVAHGYTVLQASSAAEALSAMSDPEQGIDLLLTDMVLPGGTQGGELADAARAMRKDLAVLYMSGYSRDSSIHGAQLDEGVNFLQKPFTSNELVAKVQEALAGRSRRVRPRSKGRRKKELDSL
jgi:two-component system cell cycle sensor histidine kinase/response regulator CckA